MAGYPSGTTLLFVGTKRGLFVLSSADRKRWTVDQHALPNTHVYNAVLDQRRQPRLFAADNGAFFGNFLRYSDDFGATWEEPASGIQFPEGSGQKLEAIWTIEPGRDDDPNTVYAGVAPASLWISQDRGANWRLNEGLFNHPTRPDWQPGAGGLCLHTIVADRFDPKRMWVAISAVGVIRTDDGGETWNFKNRNTRASFMPNIYPEWGQCVHRLVAHPTRPNVLYQQNHCGIYGSENGGDDWTDIQHNLPSEFGFPMGIDPHHPETLYVVVEEGWGRNNVGDQFAVYRSQNAGEEWEVLTEGLPSGPQVKLGVLRHGLCVDNHDPCGVYVGTNTGQLFVSSNRGDSWSLAADFLPTIYSVTTAIIS